ncbi:CFA70 protein, partial [Polyodon spathula]|nr:CFA70 protein [Polyodon spathula]
EQGVEFNFTCRFDCWEALDTLDGLAHKPVILTLVEILPKEKKQMEEKTIILGQAVVDLLPLFELNIVDHAFSGTLTLYIRLIYALCPSQPILEVAVSVLEALLSDAQLADSNLFRVSVETAYSIPEVWSTTGPQFSYMACLQVPVSLENPEVWALTGHLHYMRRDFHKASECCKRDLDFVTGASEMHPVYLRLGAIYLQEDQFAKAKLTFLRACKNFPSCLSWLGLGTACYKLVALMEAEEALAEANNLNSRNPEVWGYLSLVCLQVSIQFVTLQAFQLTTQCVLDRLPAFPFTAGLH